MKKIKLLVSSLIVCSLLTACGGSYDSVANSVNMSSDYGVASFDSVKSEGFNEEYVEFEESGSLEDTSKVDSYNYSEKLVYTASIDIQTLEYEDTIKTIKENINKYNGFIENENERNGNYYWYSSSIDEKIGAMKNSIIIRIPSDKYEDFLSSLDGCGNIMSKSQNVENITKQYYETSSMVECLEIQEQRLLDMLNSCETIEDMIAVEKRLTEVQSDLRIYKNDLSSMDSDVEYSTININVEEVVEYTVSDRTFFDKLKSTISDTCENFVNNLEGILFFSINILGYIPVILFIGVIVFIIIKLFKRKKIKKIKNINEEKNIDKINNTDKLKEKNFKDKE